MSKKIVFIIIFLLLLVTGAAFWLSVLSKPNYYTILGEKADDNIILRLDDNQVVDFKLLEEKKKLMGYVDVDLVLNDLIDKYKDKVFAEKNSQDKKQEFKTIAKWEEYIYNQKYNLQREFKDNLTVKKTLKGNQKTDIVYAKNISDLPAQIKRSEKGNTKNPQFTVEEQRAINAFLHQYPQLTDSINLSTPKKIILDRKKMNSVLKKDSTLKKTSIPSIYVTRYKLSPKDAKDAQERLEEAEKDKKVEEYEKNFWNSHAIKVECLDVYKADFCTEITDKF